MGTAKNYRNSADQVDVVTKADISRKGLPKEIRNPNTKDIVAVDREKINKVDLVTVAKGANNN